MKKFLVVLLACALIFGFATTALAADTQIVEFNDIADQTLPARNAIMKLAVLGVIEGNEGIGGAFRPTDNLTRAEFAKIVCYLTGNVKIAESLAGVGSRFTDVSTGNWYTGWVNAAAQSGYFQGDPGGTFRPNANITMQEVAAVALRAAGYTDALPGAWPGNYISKAMSVGLLDNVTFVGSTAATRSDMAVICEAVLGINMVVHISNEIAYALSLAQGNVDKDGFSEVYYVSNETFTENLETILHKAFKGEYWDLHIEPAVANTIADPRAWDESFGWSYDNYANGEISLNVLNSIAYENYRDKNKTFTDAYVIAGAPVSYGSISKTTDELASTYYITGGYNLTDLAGMQAQILVIDGDEICFVDVVSSYVTASAIMQDRSVTSTGLAQQILADDKSYNVSNTMGFSGRMANLIANGDYSASDAMPLEDTNKDDDFPGKLYLDKNGRVYGVKNYNSYDETAFGIVEDIDNSRINWKNSPGEAMKLVTSDPYVLYKDGEFIKAEDLTENDFVSRINTTDTVRFFYVTSPAEGEMTAQNKFNGRLTIDGTAYAVAPVSNAKRFQYSDDGGERFNPIQTQITATGDGDEVDFGAVEYAMHYDFAKLGYVASNIDANRIIGVITKIEPTQVWSSGARLDRYEEITIYNTEGKEVKYTFNSDFRDGYAYRANAANFFGTGNWWTASSGDPATKWANATYKLTNNTIQLKKGDIVQLALDRDEKVRRLDNYAAYAPVPKQEVKVTSSNSRINLTNFGSGVYTLHKDAIVFNVSADSDGSYDDVSIQSVASVLAKDFNATQAVPFDVKSGSDLRVFYFVGDVSVTHYGLLTGSGRNTTIGDYHVINGVNVAADRQARADERWTVVAYTMSGGEIETDKITKLASDKGVNASELGRVYTQSNQKNRAFWGKAESYSSTTKSLNITGAGAGGVYISEDTYIFDLILQKKVDIGDVLGKNVVSIVNATDLVAEFVAVVGDAALTGGFVSTDANVALVADLNLTAPPTSITSSNENVVTAVYTAPNIVITSVGAGSATITVAGTPATEKATIQVTVSATGAITIGTVTPYFASDTTTVLNTALNLASGLRTAVSSNTAVVTASVTNATTVSLTSVGAGTATITVTNTLGEVATIEVTVNNMGVISTVAIRYSAATTLNLVDLGARTDLANLPKFGDAIAGYTPTIGANAYMYTAAGSWTAGHDGTNFDAATATYVIVLTSEQATNGFDFANTDIVVKTAAQLGFGKANSATAVVSGTNDEILTITLTYAVTPLAVNAIGTLTQAVGTPAVNAATSTITTEPAVAAATGYTTAAGSWTSGVTGGVFNASGTAVYTIVLTATTPGYTFTGTTLSAADFGFSQGTVAIAVAADGTTLTVNITYNL